MAEGPEGVLRVTPVEAKVAGVVQELAVVLAMASESEGMGGGKDSRKHRRLLVKAITQMLHTVGVGAPRTYDPNLIRTTLMLYLKKRHDLTTVGVSPGLLTRAMLHPHYVEESLQLISVAQQASSVQLLHDARPALVKEWLEAGGWRAFVCGLQLARRIGMTTVGTPDGVGIPLDRGLAVALGAEQPRY